MFQHKTDIYCEHQSYQKRGEILSLKTLKIWQIVIVQHLKSVNGGNQTKFCTHSIILWHYESFDGDSIDSHGNDDQEDDGDDNHDEDDDDDDDDV